MNAPQRFGAKASRWSKSTPGRTYAPYARKLTQAMLVLHLTYILLNETVIKAVSVEGWMVYYAFLPVVHHVLLTALFRTVFWLTPEPGRR